jgi:lysophospholipase L1-like esterase
MGFGMAGSATGGRLALILGALLLAAATAGVGIAQPTPELPPVAKECGEVGSSETPLPNSAVALQERKKIKILAIGSSATDVLGSGREGGPPLLEQILERTIRGLDVEIIDRGFSGELADATATRLKIEVALNHPDIVLWQVGTNDAFAQVPVEEFAASVRDTVRWLKENKIDVILVGLHYMKQLATDPHYQAIRDSLQQIAVEENVLRIRRSEAIEILARLRESGRPEPSDFGLNEAGYNCMAQYVARAIAVGLFAKPPKWPLPQKR